MYKKYLLQIVIGISITCAAILYFVFNVRQEKKDANFAIAIVQSATHPALDQARQGFIDSIKQIAPETIFIVKNGERSVTGLHAIMDELVGMKYLDLLYAIGTPALSAVAYRDEQRPIVFTAVTDPTTLHLERRNNICGVTDAVDEAVVLKKIITLFSPKQIAVLFDPAEANSVFSKNRMLSYAKEDNVSVVEYAVSSVLDIQTAIEHMSDIDCVVLPTDNLLASAISLITRILKEKNIPCVSLFPVDEGVVFYAGVDYYDAGCTAAEYAMSILQDKKAPKDIGFSRDKRQKIKYNDAVLLSFGISVTTEYSYDKK